MKEEEEKCEDRDRGCGERWSLFVCLGRRVEETSNGFVRQAAAVGTATTPNAPVTLHIF